MKVFRALMARICTITIKGAFTRLLPSIFAIGLRLPFQLCPHFGLTNATWASRKAQRMPSYVTCGTLSHYISAQTANIAWVVVWSCHAWLNIWGSGEHTRFLSWPAATGAVWATLEPDCFPFYLPLTGSSLLKSTDS